MSKLGDKQYFQLLLIKEGYTEIQANHIIELFIRGMQDKILGGSKLVIPNFGTFKSAVLPERFNTRLQKDCGETFKVTFTPSRKGLLQKWRDNHSTEAKQRHQLEEMAKKLKKK